MHTFGRWCSVLCAAIVAVVALLSQAQAQTQLRLAHHHAVGGTVDLTANKFAELVAAK